MDPLSASARGAGVRRDVAAVVLTHRRPVLATRTVRILLDDEGFSPDRTTLVIDRDGGLTDPQLERSLQVRRLQGNLGPAAGFREGLAAAFTDPAVRWAYLCEDDACLLGVPAPRIDEVLRTLEGCENADQVGAVVVEGRAYSRRTERTTVAVADPAGPRLQHVDVAAWGMTLVSRRAVELGVLPDDHWFFGYEDFDFFLRLRAAGLRTLLDRDAALAVARRGAHELETAKLSVADESWRAYYVARNMFELTRRHGRPLWYASHLVSSLRRARHQSAAGRLAIGRGLVDGLRRRTGRDDRFVRTVGERVV